MCIIDLALLTLGLNVNKPDFNFVDNHYGHFTLASVAFNSLLVSYLINFLKKYHIHGRALQHKAIEWLELIVS